MIVGDLFFGYTALAIALFVWTSRAEWLGFSFEFFQTRVPFWFYFLPFLWVILLTDLYDPHQSLRIKDTFRRIIFSGLIGVVL
ncbi:MAG: hypothetical protein GWN00_31630, partial [Aliifodinibius sp.]|nr:hypothetical protein [Fodinibius sp.]NIY29174.1 hypothetical protein [Fodinibius sp.]